MKHISLHTLPLTLAFLAVASIALMAGKPSWDQQAAQRKADYLFLQGQNEYNLENYDAYVALTKRAYELDSADLDIAAEWGMILLSNEDADSAILARAYDNVRKLYFSNPDDYLMGTVFAEIATHAHRYDDLLEVWQTLDSIYPTNPQPAQKLARCYIVKYLTGDSTAMDKAIEIYDRLESGSGKTIQISSEKIQAFALIGDTLAAINEIKGLVEQAPKDSHTAYFAGYNYQYLNDSEKALEYFDRACQLDSAFGEAYMAKAILYQHLGDSAAYDREVFLALKSQNLDTESKIEILHSYVQDLYSDRSQEPRIRSLFDDLEQMHSGEADIYILYGSYLYAIEDFAGAAEQLSYGVALEPADESVWSALVQACVEANDSASIALYAAIAQQKFPDNLYYPSIRAIVTNLNGDTHKAIEILDSVEIKDIKNPRGVSNVILLKGDLYASLGDTLKALEIYDQAISIYPDNYMALNNAAYFMAENNIDLDKAEQYSSHVARDNDSNPTYLDTYAWVLFKKKNYTLAQCYIDMTLRLYNPPEQSDSAENAETIDSEAEYGPSSDVLEHAGDIYFMCGDPEKALDFWKQALELDPENELLARKVKNKTYFFK